METAAHGLFWGSLLAVFYSYFGYPLLLALAAHVRPRAAGAPAAAAQAADHRPTVCIVIVVHNEAERIEAKLENCLSLDYPANRREILVVSDGSTDATNEIVDRFAARGVRSVHLPAPPQGKARALGEVVQLTSAEILLMCDVRQRLEGSALRHLVAVLADSGVGAVSGELHLADTPGSETAAVGAYWRYEKQIRRLESKLDSTVGVTGAIYAIRRDLFRPPDPRTILDDVSIPMDVVLAGRRVLFEPKARAYDALPEQGRAEYRRKVRTLAGNYQLVRLRPELLDPRRNRIVWQFVSHKLTRLAVPWCLLVMLAASATLAGAGSPLHRLALAGQAVFYLLAAAAPVLGGFNLRPRLVSIPYAFTLLNLASASSLFGFLFGRERAAWKRADT